MDRWMHTWTDGWIGQQMMNADTTAHSTRALEKRTKYSGICQSLLVVGFDFLEAFLRLSGLETGNWFRSLT